MVIIQIGHGESSCKSEEDVDPYREHRRLVRIPSTPRWLPVQYIETSLEAASRLRALFIFGDSIVSQMNGWVTLLNGNSCGRCIRPLSCLCIHRRHHLHQPATYTGRSECYSCRKDGVYKAGYQSWTIVSVRRGSAWCRSSR